MIAMLSVFVRPIYTMPTSLPTAFIPCEYALSHIETVVSYGNMCLVESRVTAFGAVPCAYVRCAHSNAIVSSAVRNMLRCLFIVFPYASLYNYRINSILPRYVPLFVV